MAIGYRPKGEHGPAYHPERDYAYVTPTLMCAGVERAAKPATVEALQWQEEQGITADAVIAAAEALARAQRDFINAADPVTSFEQALARRDFTDIPYLVRQLLFASIGEVFCAAWFVAVRDVTRVNEESPAAAGMADFIATVRSVVGAKVLPTKQEQQLAQLQLRNDLLQSRVNSLGEQLQKLNALLSEKAAIATLAPPIEKSTAKKSLFNRLIFWK
jgi:hypothetical protein